MAIESGGQVSADTSFFKRLFDILVASAMAVAFAPLMIVVALLIMIADGRPVLFAHQRIGRGGKPFMCLKFRTMRRDSQEMLARILAEDPARAQEWRQTRKLTDDPRILPFVGRLLRKSSLDELPQIWNVLCGDMSIVGPRPVPKDELVELYGGMSPYYLSVKPGLTGPWQIGGRNDLSYDERVALDVDYAQNWTLAGDAVIVANTAKVLLGSRSAH